jgi:hypothetical protein
MNLPNSMLSNTFFSLFFIFFSCNSAALQNSIPSSLAGPKRAVREPQVSLNSNTSAEDFIKVHQLGKKTTLETKFDNFLSKIPNNIKRSRVYLARIDDLPIGKTYSGLDKWDVALETGLIDGLIERKINIVEKLDHIKPRNSTEYIGNSPEDAFYMHGIDLEDLKSIKNKLKATNLLTYQIMDFSEKSSTVVVYFRMIDLKKMKIISSSLISLGEDISLAAEKEINAFNQTFEVLKTIDDFPKSIFRTDNSIALLNSDILNIGGTYNNPPSKKAMAIENGIITGFINNNSYKSDNPIIIEKTKGFKLKYPSVYNSIVFNTNPLIYEDWSEFTAATNCSYLLMYRYIDEYALYLKVVDAEQNGKILYSNTFLFKDKLDKGIVANYKFISSNFKDKVNLDLIKGKKSLILDGDKQSVESEQYFKNQPSFNEMNLAVEEGIISALVSSDIPVYEKLKTLYLKRPWMYEDKIFNLNPLYLDNWSQLNDFGVEKLIVYNNLIEYEKLVTTDPNYKKIALGVRIIDIATGDIVDVAELSNLNEVE